MGYSCLGAGSWKGWGAGENESLMTEEVIKAAAAAQGKSPAQILLKWGAQRGYTILTKSSNQGRLAENLDLFSFTLTEE